MKKKAYYIGGISAILGLVLLDQFTKYLAVLHLKDQRPYIIMEKIFSLQYLENRGAAFGMFENQQIVFIISTVLILSMIIYFFFKTPKERRFHPLLVAAVFVVAGAIGNCIDRLRLGYVVDFFYFEPINFPIFNVADCYIVVALFVFSFLLLFYYKEEELTFFTFSLKKKSKE